MSEKKTSPMIHVLVIEDDPDDRTLIAAMLEGREAEFRLSFESTLEAGLAMFDSAKPDAVLLDLNLPDSQGLNTFATAKERVGGAPIVILTGHNDETFALEALRAGAQDYLPKSGLEKNACRRALRYALERSRSDARLRELLMTDESTGLYNRRGFLTFGDQYLKLAERNGEGIVVFCAKLANGRRICETFGGHEADLALLRAAKAIRDTFRKSDVIGYLGEDLFAALTLDTGPDKYPTIRDRLIQTLAAQRAAMSARFDLVLETGFSHHDARQSAADVEKLLSEAMASLGYGDKKSDK